MKNLSPLNSNYMKNIGIDELIREERESRLCDAKIRLGQYLMLYSSYMDESLDDDTKELLIKKRSKRFQILEDAYKKLSIQN